MRSSKSICCSSTGLRSKTLNKLAPNPDCLISSGGTGFPLDKLLSVFVVGAVGQQNKRACVLGGRGHKMQRCEVPFSKDFYSMAANILPSPCCEEGKQLNYSWIPQVHAVALTQCPKQRCLPRQSFIPWPLTNLTSFFSAQKHKNSPSNITLLSN